MEFDVMVRPTCINIYETYNPGAVIAVKAQNMMGQWVTLWSTNKPEHLHDSRIFSPTIKVNHSYWADP